MPANSSLLNSISDFLYAMKQKFVYYGKQKL